MLTHVMHVVGPPCSHQTVFATTVRHTVSNGHAGLIAQGCTKLSRGQETWMPPQMVPWQQPSTDQVLQKVQC